MDFCAFEPQRCHQSGWRERRLRHPNAGSEMLASAQDRSVRNTLLRLALLRCHSRPDRTGRSTRPRCVGQPRQLSGRQGHLGTAQRHRENLNLADERNMVAATGSGGQRRGAMQVSIPATEHLNR
jgi:hypothetical protein